MPDAPRALVAVPDLLLRPKVEEGLRAAGWVATVTRPRDLPAQAAVDTPSCAVVELEAKGALDAVRALKGDPRTAAVPVLGFCGHTKVELIREAREAGCDRVVARSEIARRLDRLVAELATR